MAQFAKRPGACVERNRTSYLLEAARAVGQGTAAVFMRRAVLWNVFLGGRSARID